MRDARAWLVLLAACAVTFAATTIYLWRELEEEQAQPSTALVAAPAVRTVPRQSVVAYGTGTGPGARVEAPTTAGTTLNANVDPAEYQRLQSRQLLEQLADPAARERALEASRAAIRNAYPWLAERLKLDPQEYEKLIDTLARNNLEERETHAKCAADPACNMGDVISPVEQQNRALADLLGPERMKQFETYQQTLNERETVLNLRGRLPDHAFLSAEQSESLVSALAEESWQMQRDARTSGQGVAGFGMGSSWIYYRANGTPEQQIKSAEAYVSRMIARAAQVLTPDQMRYFTQMQQDLLANLRNQLENPTPDRP